MSASDNYQSADSTQKKVLPPLNEEQVSGAHMLAAMKQVPDCLVTSFAVAVHSIFF